MLHNDRKSLLRQEATERMTVELASRVQFHENMARLYHYHSLEEAEYMENVLVDMYKSFYREMKEMRK